MSYYELSLDKSYKFVVWEATKSEYLSHFHRNIEIIYVISGEMDATVNGVDYRVKKDEILFVPGFFTHAYTTPAEVRLLTVLIPNYHISDFCDLFKKNNLPPYLNDRTYNRRIILKLLQEIKINQNPEDLDEVTSPYSNIYVEKGWVNIIIGELVAHYPLVAYSRSKDDTIIMSVLEIISDRFSQNLTLDSVSDSLGYNKYYVSKLFHKYVGINFRSYLNLVRIQHIQNQHLLNAKTDMTKLILDSGYNSLSTYYRAVKSLNIKV